ncbi:MAG: chromosome partitioning protein ParB [Betaproteobacteria bacterium HGW-Betaproteobacteria-2]|nr:MAG: chromosome partitioning protein ParB [Betaproteobacteria bacterium HGW-Betaproteobacteria-2]
MVKLKGLGRGLDSLLAGDDSASGDGDALKMLKVGQLQPGKYQPRTQMDEESLASLADSIRTQGIMQPILVREIGDERYEIIAGERRWRASQLAGLEQVPVLVRDIPDESALAMALIENIQRENLNPIEEAQGIKRLIDEFDMTHQLAAEAVGRSRAAVTNLLRLLNLLPAVQNMVMQGEIEMGHARALLALDGAKQVMAAEQVAAKGLSVREAEQLAKRLVADIKKPAKQVAQDRDVLRLQENLAEQLGAPVHIQTGRGGAGTLKIRYSNLDQLDDIIAKLKGSSH